MCVCGGGGGGREGVDRQVADRKISSRRYLHLNQVPLAAITAEPLLLLCRDAPDHPHSRSSLPGGSSWPADVQQAN